MHTKQVQEAHVSIAKWWKIVSNGAFCDGVGPQIYIALVYISSLGDGDDVEAQIPPIGVKAAEEGYVPIAKWWTADTNGACCGDV